MKNRYSCSILLGLLSTVLFTACGPVSTAQPPPTVMITATFMPTATRIPPTATPAPSATPVVEPTATPISLPQFKPLLQLGRGTVEQITVSADGQWVAALSSSGLRIHASATLQVAQTLDLGTFVVTQIAFSPDGQKLALVGAQNIVKIWDVAQAQFVADIVMPEVQHIYRLAWSPKGTQLAISTRLPEEKILIVDVASGQSTLSLPTLSEDELVWSPDGTRLARFNSHSLQVNDLVQPNSEPVIIVADLDTPIQSVAWSPDGQRIAAGSNSYDPFTANNFLLRIWSAPSGAQRAQVSLDLGSAEAITQLAWSPDEAWLAVSTETGRIQLWNSITGQRQKDFEGHVAEVTSIAWLPNSQELLSGSRDGTLRSWQVATGRQTRSTGEEGEQPPLTLQVKWSPVGYQLALAGADGTIQIWEAQTGQLVTTLRGHRGAVNSLAWVPNGDELVSGGEDGTVRFWDVDTSSEYWQVSKESEGKRHPALSVDWQGGGLVAVGYKNLGFTYGGVQAWDINTKKLIWEREKLFGWGEAVSAVRWSSDGKLLATTAVSGNLIIFNDVGEEAYRDTEFRAEAEDLVWSPTNEKILILYSSEKSDPLSIWDLSQVNPMLQAIEIPPPPDYFPAGIDWSHNNLWWLVGEGPANNIQIWDATLMKSVQSLEGHTKNILSVAWSYDDHFIASASEDGTIRIWEASNP